VRRFLQRLVLVPLALLFLFEAWLWDRLAPLVAALVARLPLGAWKEAIRAFVACLSPGWTLAVFVIPAALLFPLKLLGLWFFGRGEWFFGALTIAFAKLVGVGVTAFLFDATREKLLGLRWFRAVYDFVLRVKAWAEALVAPVKREIRRLGRLLGPGRAGRSFRLLRRLRRYRGVLR
jgi:hypothetical protein